jgi:hypothetical protein
MLLFAAGAVLSFVASPLLWTLVSDAPVTLVPLACVCGWLAAVHRFEAQRQFVWAAVAGASLGAGVYFTLPATVMMPCFAALTVAIAVPTRVMTVRDGLAFIAAFVLVCAPFFIGWLMQPEEFRAVVNSHHLYDANRFTVLQGAREVGSWVGLTARSEVLWDYLNPAFLFATGRVLAWPLVVLVPIGIYVVLARDTTLLGRLALAGYLASPLAASLTAEPPIRSRISWMLPFAALLSAFAAVAIKQWLRPQPHEGR